MSEFIVIKLGGTSQCKKGYDALINYIKIQSLTEKYNIIIVLSAISGITTLLDKYTMTKDITFIHDVEDLHEELIESFFGVDENYIDCDITEHDKIICNDINDIDDMYKLNIKKKFLIEWNKLTDLIKDYTNMDDIRKRAEIIGFGERLSTNIFHSYIKLKQFDPNTNIHLINSYNFIKSKKESYKLFPSVEFTGDLENFNKEWMKENNDYLKNNIIITQGFIASSLSGEPLLLGRGGSDTTGSIISNMVGATFYEVWTDVEGIYTADPRIFNNVKHIETISYELIQELAAMGAKVMHPLSIIPCQLKSIPIYVKSTFNIDGKQTKIHDEDFNDICIAIQKNVSVFHIKSMNMWNSYGFVNDIFRRFAQNQVDVNIITTSQFSISTTTNETNTYVLKDLEQDLNKDYETKLVQNCIILSVVSNNVKKIMSRINFEIISSEIIHIGSNNLSINIVMKEQTNDFIKIIIEKLFNYT